MNSPFSRSSDGEQRSDRAWGLPWGAPVELDELVDRLGRWAERATGGRTRAAHWTPVVEEDEIADAYRVRVELPGIPRERVSVEVEGHQLVVRGEPAEAGAGGSNHLALRAGSFACRTSLPADADREDVRADLADGVLTVTVARAGHTSRKTVPITVTSKGSTVEAGQVPTGTTEATGTTGETWVAGETGESGGEPTAE